MSGRRPDRKSQRKPKLVVDSTVKLQTSGVPAAALDALIADYKRQGYEVVGRQGTRGGGVTLVRKKAVATAANVEDLADLFGGLGMAAAAEPTPVNARMDALAAVMGGLNIGSKAGIQVGGRRYHRKTHRRRR